MKKTLIANIKILETREDGGRIRINTDAVDRDKDRVFPAGAQFDNYLKNPVVMWGHNYSDPWAVIGRTNSIEQTESYIDVDFDLRGPSSDNDPIKIINALWNDRLVNTASIGFMPLGDFDRNELGGWDFTEWELLEWSLVPIPANQEALRLAYKACTPDLSGKPEETNQDIEQTQQGATQSDFGDFVSDFVGDFAKSAAEKEDAEYLDNKDESNEDESEETETVEANNDDPTNNATDADQVTEFFKQLDKAINGGLQNE